MAPITKANAEVVAHPQIRTFAPKSFNVFASLVCFSVRMASIGYKKNCAASLDTPPAIRACFFVCAKSDCLCFGRVINDCSYLV